MDRLSNLPDDIMVHIMSFLSAEEVSRTNLNLSFASRFWRRRWLLSVDEFDFNTCEFIKPKLDYAAFESFDKTALKRRFFKWMNRVLRSLRDHDEGEASVIRKLRIPFPLHLKEKYQKKIGEWLSYAFVRRVQSLELDLLHNSCPKTLTLNDPRLLVSGAETDMSCLVSLSLSGVNVSRQDMDYFLLNCPFLQHLKVCSSVTLESVEICGSISPALKHVEITHCLPLTHLIVRDTCLVSLTLTSANSLVLENNQKLVSVCVDHWYYHSGSTLEMLSSRLSRLQILTLNLGYRHDEVFDQVPKLVELKQLTLVACPLHKYVQLRLTTMLRLSPNLEKLVLDLLMPRARRIEGKYIQYEECSKIRLNQLKVVEEIRLNQLKVVEVRGYYGKIYEDELFIYLLERVLAPIETIIFDPHYLRWNNWRTKEGWLEIEKRVELFKRIIPSSIKFLVL